MSDVKGYNGNTHLVRARCTPEWHSQVRACVQTSSWAKLAALVGESVASCRKYWNQHLSDEMAEALATYPPDTVLVRGLDPGDLIDGQPGWVRMVILPEDRP